MLWPDDVDEPRHSQIRKAKPNPYNLTPVESESLRQDLKEILLAWGKAELARTKETKAKKAPATPSSAKRKSQHRRAP